MTNTWVSLVWHIEASKVVATWTRAMEVRFLASGEILTTLDQDVFDGKTAREVKQTLAANVRVSRFRQRLFTEDGFHEIHDDEVFGSAPVQVQLVMLEFLPPDAEEDELMISACHRNNTVRLEKILQGPRNPNLSGAHGSKLFRLPKLVEGSLEVKLPTIWTDEKQSREEAERRERLEERRVEEKESEERRCRCAKR